MRRQSIKAQPLCLAEYRPARAPQPVGNLPHRMCGPQGDEFAKLLVGPTGHCGLGRGGPQRHLSCLRFAPRLLQSHFFHMKALLTLTAAHFARSELRSDLPSALAALGAEELRLDVRQPHVVGPAVSIDLDVMAATMVAAVDQHVARAGCAHLAEGDLLRVGRHGFRHDSSTPNISHFRSRSRCRWSVRSYADLRVCAIQRRMPRRRL